MTTKHYSRPTSTYTGEAGLSNRTKYYTDSTSSPKVPISSTKIDGDFNYLVDAVNELYDTAVTGVVADGSITNAKLRSSTALSVIGRSDNTSGQPADIVAATENTILLRKSNVVQFSTIPAGSFENSAVTTSDIANTNVTFAKIQNVATGVLVGRSTAGTGSIEAITPSTGLTLTGGALSVNTATTSVAGISKLPTYAYATTNTQVSVATATWTATGLSVAITPATSSQVVKLEIAQSTYGTPQAGGNQTRYSLRLKRDSTVIATWTELGTIVTGNGATNTQDGINRMNTFLFVDTPATTSAVTYSMEMIPVSVGTLYAQYGSATPSCIIATTLE